MGDVAIGTVTNPYYMSVSSDDRKWKTKMKKLLERYPDEVIFRSEDDGYGYMTIWVPMNWVNVRKPIKKNLTDEQREELRARVARINPKLRYATEENDEIPFSDELDGQIDVEELIEENWD